MLVKYSSNNSGGSWWLKDADWKNLEDAGWDVEWERDRDRPYLKADKDGRWLGALAKYASKEVNSPDEAVKDFERITGQDASAEGCNCCGPPHSFSHRDEDGDYHYSSVTVTETKLEWN